MAGKETPAKLEVSDMNIYQLNAIRVQLEQEIELLAKSVEQLAVLMNRFKESEMSVYKQSQLGANNEILVPLTTSMYVNGVVKENKKFLVDIGTGYYVEKDLESALDYFSRKVKYLNGEIDRLTKTIQAKANMREAIIADFQYKTQQNVAATN